MSLPQRYTCGLCLPIIPPSLETSSVQLSCGYHASTINKALTLKRANERGTWQTYQPGPLSFPANYPGQHENISPWIKVRPETFPHHLMSESSDAAIDSLNQSCNEERNHNSNSHFKQKI